MDQEDRLKVKRAILAKSRQGKQISEVLRGAEQPIPEVPWLRYKNLEIIDPDSVVDDELIKLLDHGEEELTDELFFELIRESPDYLAFQPFRKKIKEWQATLRSPIVSQKERSQAQKKLKQIGNKLGFIGQRRPKQYEHLTFQIRVDLKALVDHLSPFLEETRSFNLSQKRKLFEEKFPFWTEYSKIVTRHRSALEIAKAILVEKHGISRRQLDILLKSIIIMPFRDVPPGEPSDK